MNPFSVAIAQGIAGLPLMSGADYRIVLWLLFTLFGIVFTMRYAAKIKKNPELSVSFTSDQKLRAQQQEQQSSSFGKLDAAILLLFVAGIIWVIWGVVARGYYIPEIATQFFA